MSDADPRFERRRTADRGMGVFATCFIPAGERLFAIAGQTLTTAELTDDLRALQIGPDLWLASDGTSLDDDVNHSCNPSAGFHDGQPVLCAIRNIQPGDEISWDYSTSINEPGWQLDCRCGCEHCRGVIRPWHELSDAERTRLAPFALFYLTQDK
jgi:hypothetical protein